MTRSPGPLGPRRTTGSRAFVPSFNFLMIVALFTVTGIVIGRGLVQGAGIALVFVFSGWVLSLCLHEFGHAVVAYKGGDASIAGTGYLTLDPVRFVNPVLSIVLPLVFTLLGGIGFPGGSVFVDQSRLRSEAWRSAVSAAGPFANLLFMLVLLVLYHWTATNPGDIGAVLAFLAFLQATTIVLNILPIPGLDGYGIIRPLLPMSWRDTGDRMALFSGLIITGLFLFVGLFGRAVFFGGLRITTALGIDPSDVFAGFQMIRLW
ncbi:site-2 protease family protein [Lichenifustis flavocetrariae]|uniref:Site-2 protease family protein n=1 Tax=Lichenifustis flavocetrariae TaxID=2949735 RepID=A0AA42CM46_9HYPH|nr:site-2 protease family protein [Lichenifustis flavocetrariae]MCW6507985.1 site-2 protease family protein [Lichenifustis flavocetrariae]